MAASGGDTPYFGTPQISEQKLQEKGMFVWIYIVIRKGMCFWVYIVISKFCHEHNRNVNV